MTLPDPRSDLVVELAFAPDTSTPVPTWPWVDVTGDLLNQAVTITRGRPDEGSAPQPSACTLVLDNANGHYTPGQALSPFFPNVDTGAYVRISVAGSVRFVGQVGSWEPTWPDGDLSDLDDLGELDDEAAVRGESRVTIRAAGILRRLGQGADPLRSAPERFITATDPYAYWPLYEGPDVKDGAALAGASPLRPDPGSALSDLTYPPVWGEGNLASWLPATLRLANQTEKPFGSRLASGLEGSSSSWVVDFLYRLNNGPSRTALSIRGDPDTNNIDVTIRLDVVPFVSDEYIVVIFSELDPPSSVIGEAASGTREAYDGRIHHVRLSVTQSGSGSDFDLFLDGRQIITGTATDVITPRDINIRHDVPSPGDEVASADVGHLALWDAAGAPTVVDAASAAFGHAGEHAGRRIERLCAEEGVPFVGDGDLDDTLPLGPENLATLLELLLDAAEIDHGILYEPRNDFGLVYRTGRSLFNQTPALTLDAKSGGRGDIVNPFAPVLDDQAIRNDVTVKRRDGGQARTVDQTSVDTIGRYNTSVTVNCLSDVDTGNQAEWRLHIGTWPGMRYPSVSPALNVRPGIVPTWEVLGLGDRISVINLPPQHPVGSVSLLALGYAETLRPPRWDVDINCVPEGPYHIAEVEHADYSTIGSGAIPGVSSVLGEDLDPTETDVGLALGAGPDWVHEVDFDILVAGEVMTVTAVAPAIGTFPDRTQVLTVIRSVNGIVKSHPTSPQAPVDVLHKSYFGL